MYSKSKIGLVPADLHNLNEPSLQEICQDERLLRSLGLVDASFSLQAEVADLANPWFPKPYPSAWFWQEAPTELSADQLLADLPYLRFVMQQAYIGWEIAEANGWDWKKFFSNWAQRFVPRRGELVTWAEAFEPWQNLMRYQLDNHSGPRSAVSQSSLSHTVLLLDFRLDADNATQTSAEPWEAFLPDFSNGEWQRVKAMSCPNLRTVELGTTSPDRVQEQRSCRRESLRLFGVENETDLLYRELTSSISYLRIPTLTPRVDAAAQVLDSRLPRSVFRHRSVIIDLRGNGGGMAPAVFNILDRLPGWRELDWQKSFSIRTKTSRVADALQWGAVQAQLKDAPVPLPNATRERFQMVLNNVQRPRFENPEPLINDFRSPISFLDHRFPCKPRPGHSQITLLTDSDCGSDGEFLVYALSLIPGSVILGISTGGVAQFARPGLFLLPHTRVPFRLASAFIDLYGDGRAFDGRGFKPDILLDQTQVLSPAMLINILARLPELTGTWR